MISVGHDFALIPKLVRDMGHVLSLRILHKVTNRSCGSSAFGRGTTATEEVPTFGAHHTKEAPTRCAELGRVLIHSSRSSGKLQFCHTTTTSPQTEHTRINIDARTAIDAASYSLLLCTRPKELFENINLDFFGFPQCGSGKMKEKQIKKHIVIREESLTFWTHCFLYVAS